MEFLPIFLRLRGQPCLVVGGGDVAHRKVQMLLKAGAQVTVIAPAIHASLMALGLDHCIRLLERPFEVGDVGDVALVVAATNQSAVNQAVFDAAQLRQIPVNVVDCPDLCTFIFPAIVDRSPLVMAVSTGGASPVMARNARARLERLFPKAYGTLALFAEERRNLVRQTLSDNTERRRFWERIFEGPVRDQVLSGDLQGASGQFDAELLACAGDTQQSPGFVSLVGAGPGDPELLTLKAFRLLQEADTIVHDRLVSSDILDLGRRDATLIDVGKESSNHTLPQEDITDLLVRLARKGQRVVRLKGGDPFIFGRGGEEIDGIMKAGIDFQVVPGITSASGCSTYAGIPLTHRDHSQSVVFLTGHASDTEINEAAWQAQWQCYAKSRQTLVIYMGVRNLESIRDALLEHGAEPSTPVAIIERGTTPKQRVHIGSLSQLPETRVESPAIIIMGTVVSLRYP